MGPSRVSGVCALLLTLVVGAFAAHLAQVVPGTPVGTLSPEHRARLERKAKAVSRETTFSEPDRAMAFYVNSRTGPILTRGANITTGTRALDPALYLPAIAQLRDMPRYDSATNTRLPPAASRDPGEDELLATWSPLGPTNQGGRTRGLLIDPVDPNIMYAGGVAGGVWKSTDAGGTWMPVADLMANIAIGTLAFDPQDSSVIYAGTGEGFFNFDAIRGAGIFRSTDAGLSWSLLASTSNANFHYTMKIVVSPRNSQRIFAATRAGLFRSTNGGDSWGALPVTVNGGCTDLAMQVGGAAGYLFVSCGTFAQATIYRIADNDASAPEGVFSPAGMGRASIAVAPSNESILYVLGAQHSAGGGPGVHGLHGVYRSTANGDPGSFTTQRQGTVEPASTAEKINQLLLSNPVIALLTECGLGVSSFANQGWYDNVIAVDPLDANRIWAGGIDLWRSDDGGVNWGTAGFWWFTRGAQPLYHHADQHAIVFHPHYNGTSNRVMFAGSDGGIDRIDDARAAVNSTLPQLCGTTPVGAPWIDRNTGYVTTQFFDGVPYPSGQTFFGGLQDNGTLRGNAGDQNWSVLWGGDGGYVAVDTLNDANAGNDVLFLTNTGLSLQKSVNGGATFAPAISGIVTDLGFAFIAPFTMNAASKQQLWTGGWYVWRTTNQAATWVRASAEASGSGSISALAAHPLDPNRVLVGMSDGYIHHTTTALTNTSATSWPQTRPADGFVSWVAWDPNNVDLAYATVSRFGAATIFKSVNGGATWTATQGTGGSALPQIPALSVVVNPANSQQVFVGTDLGVFVSIDGGASWLLENAGFANTPVEALKFNETTPRRLFAFTHGRGAWRVGLACPVISVTPTTLASGTAGAPYSQTVVGSGGSGPYAFIVEPGTAPPPGLTLSSGGTLSGTPTTAGAYDFAVRATDANSCSGTRTYSLVIAPSPCPVITLAPGALPNGTVFTPYSQTITASGNPGPFAFGVTSGTLPPGLTLSPAGGLTGTPAATGTFTFTVTATAPGGCTGAQAYSVTIGGTTSTTTVTFEPGPYIYRGTPFTATAIVTGPGGLIQSLPVTYTGDCTIPTTANGCTASARFAGNLSYGPSEDAQSITIVHPTDAQPPTNVRVDAVEGNAVRFRWTAPRFGPRPESYVLEGGLSSAIVLASQDTASDQPVYDIVVPSGSWVAWFRTVAAGTVSGRSNEVEVRVNAGAPAPTAPTGLTGVVVGSTLALSWKNTFEGGTPSSIVLDVTGSAMTSIPLGLTESFAFSGVPDGTYAVSVRAVNASGPSAASAPLTLTLPGACTGVPAEPVNLLAYRVGRVVSIIWDPPASGAAPTSYVLSVAESFAGVLRLAARAISAPVTPGSYTISVAAENACGTSPFTASQTVVVP